MEMNNIALNYKGWTISIANHTGFGSHADHKTREVAIWETDNSQSQIEIVDTYGDDVTSLLTAIQKAIDDINSYTGES